MGRQFLSFWTFSDPNVLWVVLGSLLLGASAGLIGTFALLRKQALAGDALAHAALPGVTTAFILFQSREPYVILSGALVSCFIGFFCIQFLTDHTKIKQDSALAIVLSFFFAVGVFHLSYIQKLPIGNQSGLDKLLFGQAASLVKGDVMLLGGVALFITVSVALYVEKFKFISFDRNFSKVVGMNVVGYEIFLAILIVLSVVIGLQLVGVVLMAAMLLTPGAAARYWSDEVKVILLIAALFGALSGIFGANVSYLAPSMPTGPWAVVALTFCFALSLAFAPHKGIVARHRLRSRFRHKIANENFLRTLYKFHERGEPRLVPASAILAYRNLDIRSLEACIYRLIHSGHVREENRSYGLTDKGMAEAKKVTRSHRLWELYLSTIANISPDHVHADAEEIEHILTPELEEALLAELEAAGPELLKDPHGKLIPEAD